MTLKDVFKLAANNLKRNRSRTAMTVIGVMIGVAALLTLLAYGAGAQRNARSEFSSMELYNALRLSSKPNPMQSFSDISFRQVAPQKSTAKSIPLTDDLLAKIGKMEGVLAAYPEITFPVLLRANKRELAAAAEAIPLFYRSVPAYQPPHGRFFNQVDEKGIMLSGSMATRLGYTPAHKIVGQEIQLVTASLNMKAMKTAMDMLALGSTTLPIQEQAQNIKVVGLLPENGQAITGAFRIVIPIKTAQSVQKLTFFNTVDLLMRQGVSGGHPSVRVQLKSIDDYVPVRKKIEEMGVYVSSFREQFEQLNKLFRIMDLALAVVGFIALLVATIGIANTMTMSVMERYKEIGIMKAVGADEGDLQRLFLAESTLIGLIGALIGLIFGWIIMIFLNWGANTYLSQFGVPYIDVFYAPLGMILGIVAGTLLISLIAGVSPARKAAKIPPIDALRK